MEKANKFFLTNDKSGLGCVGSFQEQCKIKTQRVYNSDFKSDQINEIL